MGWSGMGWGEVEWDGRINGRDERSVERDERKRERRESEEDGKGRETREAATSIILTAPLTACK